MIKPYETLLSEAHRSRPQEFTEGQSLLVGLPVQQLDLRLVQLLPTRQEDDGRNDEPWKLVVADALRGLTILDSDGRLVGDSFSHIGYSTPACVACFTNSFLVCSQPEAGAATGSPELSVVMGDLDRTFPFPAESQRLPREVHAMDIDQTCVLIAGHLSSDLLFFQIRGGEFLRTLNVGSLMIDSLVSTRDGFIVSGPAITDSGVIIRSFNRLFRLKYHLGHHEHRALLQHTNSSLSYSAENDVSLIFLHLSRLLLVLDSRGVVLASVKAPESALYPSCNADVASSLIVRGELLLATGDRYTGIVSLWRYDLPQLNSSGHSSHLLC